MFCPWDDKCALCTGIAVMSEWIQTFLHNCIFTHSYKVDRVLTIANYSSKLFYLILVAQSFGEDLNLSVPWLFTIFQIIQIQKPNVDTLTTHFCICLKNICVILQL